ncbi:hypothetical protein HJ588_06230 [Flexivirga sp. ID2601S]|uniref:DUF559 domain-containing protein n=1 Tax=Flexivirga aerilata TaxID=1656889 RepID=A0A849AKF0_9MICO|nr:hypothetical protein [Flexivirga aerilata]NNG38870.1 hypothetical protein [Flexivirga aerilata]
MIFTTAQAERAGVSRRQLAGPDYRQLIRGSYWRVGSAPTLGQRVRYLLATLPAARFASHHTAASLWGAVTPMASDIHLGTRKRRHTEHRGVRFHFYTHAPELLMVKGIAVTSPRQTFLDLAAHLEFIDLLILGDSLVRRARVTPAQLIDFVADKHSTGAAKAREVAHFVRARVDSPNESRLRLLMVSAGFPEPVVNHVVRIGARWREIDMSYPKLKLAFEFDGRHHIEREQQWEADILRREEVEAIGWRFIVITSTSMYADPLAVLGRIVDAVQLASGVRLRIGDGWRRHFG